MKTKRNLESNGRKLPKGWRELCHDETGKWAGLEPYCGECHIGITGKTYCACGKAPPAPAAVAQTDA